MTTPVLKLRRESIVAKRTCERCGWETLADVVKGHAVTQCPRCGGTVRLEEVRDTFPPNVPGVEFLRSSGQGRGLLFNLTLGMGVVSLLAVLVSVGCYMVWMPSTYIRGSLLTWVPKNPAWSLVWLPAGIGAVGLLLGITSALKRKVADQGTRRWLMYAVVLNALAILLTVVVILIYNHQMTTQFPGR